MDDDKSTLIVRNMAETLERGLKICSMLEDWSVERGDKSNPDEIREDIMFDLFAAIVVLDATSRIDVRKTLIMGLSQDTSDVRDLFVNIVKSHKSKSEDDE